MKKTKLEEYQDDLEGMLNIPEATMKVVGDPVIVYDFPINGEIGEVSKYQGLFDVLHNATENDVVILHINTPGGLLNTAQQICAEISSAPCAVIGNVVGECSSAGTLIALSCQELNIDPDASFLFHSMSYGTGGIASHVESYVVHSKELMRRVAEKYYTGILTEEEITNLIRGDQLYFFGDEIKRRLDQKQEKEQQEEQECALKDMPIEALEELSDEINTVLADKYEALETEEDVVEEY